MSFEQLLSSIGCDSNPLLSIEEAQMVCESDKEIATMVELSLMQVFSVPKFITSLFDMFDLGADPEKLAEITYRAIVTHCLNNLPHD